MFIESVLSVVVAMFASSLSVNALAVYFAQAHAIAAFFRHWFSFGSVCVVMKTMMRRMLMQTMTMTTLQVASTT